MRKRRGAARTSKCSSFLTADISSIPEAPSYPIVGAVEREITKRPGPVIDAYQLEQFGEVALGNPKNVTTHQSGRLAYTPEDVFIVTQAT